MKSASSNFAGGINSEGPSDIPAAVWNVVRRDHGDRQFSL